MKFFIPVLFFIICSFNLSAQYLNYGEIEKEFRNDTAKVERIFNKSMNDDSTTLGVIAAYNDLEKNYDELLNKYYAKLIGSLEGDSKTALRNTQRNWIKLRDSDKALVKELHIKEYNDGGGGTVWGVVSASYKAGITKNRVIEIYNYLMFGDLGGR